jgi:hypothetical protein
MAPPIRVGALDLTEARDLVDALAVRGLIATVEESAGETRIELNEPHEETERLLADLTVALQVWLADRGRNAVDVHLADRSIVVVAPGGIDSTLQMRLRGTSLPNTERG